MVCVQFVFVNGAVQSREYVGSFCPDDVDSSDGDADDDDDSCLRVVSSYTAADVTYS